MSTLCRYKSSKSLASNDIHAIAGGKISRGELAQYTRGLQELRAAFLFESNRLRPYSTRRIRQIIHGYAVAAGVQKRVYPHLFRHQIITFLTKKGIIS